MPVLCANVRSIKGKLTEIKCFSTQYDILCLTETHLDDSIHSSMILSPEDKIIHRTDRNIHGGGVIIAVRSDLEQNRVCLASVKNLEYVCVTVKGDTADHFENIFLCIYNPPATNLSTELQSALDELREIYPMQRLILLGDFNLPDIDWTKNSVREGSGHKAAHLSFLNLMAEFDMNQHILESTHVKGNTLDLLLSSHPDTILNSQVIEPGVSDHFLIDFSVNIKKSVNRPEGKKINLYQKADTASISRDLTDCYNRVKQSISKKESIDNIWSVFLTDLRDTIARNVPVKEIRPKNPHEPVWFNRTARKIVSKQRSLYNRYKKSGQSTHLVEYKQFQREGKRKMKDLEQVYLERHLYEPMSRGDSKPFFSFISKQTEERGDLKELLDSEGNSCKDKSEMADILNKYFESVFNKSESQYLKRDKEECYEIEVDREGVIAMINNLKNGKAPGPDGIRKEHMTLDIIGTADILTIIFQYSLDTGTLPMDWKTANVVPVYKGGNKKLASNYRPVSLTSICCKMLEHVIATHIRSALDDYLSPNQHGFRKRLSCTTQLITTVHDIMSIADKGEGIQSVVLDFSKAFDKVPHEKTSAEITQKPNRERSCKMD